MYMQLNFRQLGELLKQLGNGRIGFDHKRYTMADLQRFIAAWIAQGNYTQAHVDALASGILSGAVVPPAPSVAPAAPAMPLPAAPGTAPAVTVPVFAPRAVAAAVAAAPVPVAPQPFATHVADVAADVVINDMLDAMQPSPLIHVAHHDGAPRRVSAREVFADQPDVAALLPDDCSLLHYGHPDAPIIDSLYQFDAKVLRICLHSLSLDKPVPVWLAGPAGTGKTELVRQLAARLGRAFFRVNYTRATEPADVLGDMGLEAGNTSFQYGPAAQGFKVAGAIVLHDEITYAAQGYLAALNPVLERNGAPVRLPRVGELLSVADHVANFAADNTLGHGDIGGEYLGRNSGMGIDTLSRFMFKVRMQYLPEAQEAKLLRAVVQRDTGRKLSAAIANAIIKVSRVARTEADSGELRGAPGLRACVAMGILIVCGETAESAYECAVTLGAPPESWEKLRGCFATHWPNAAELAAAANFVQGN